MGAGRDDRHHPRRTAVLEAAGLVRRVGDSLVVDPVLDVADPATAHSAAAARLSSLCQAVTAAAAEHTTDATDGPGGWLVAGTNPGSGRCCSARGAVRGMAADTAADESASNQVPIRCVRVSAQFWNSRHIQVRGPTTLSAGPHAGWYSLLFWNEVTADCVCGPNWPSTPML